MKDLDYDIYELIKLANSGDKKAQECIVIQNTPLVWSIVNRFTGRGCEKQDLFQIGCMGLLKAVTRFDCSMEFKFSTYAVPMIIGEIKRFLRDDGIIKVSRSVKETATKAKAVAERLRQTTGGEVGINQISEELNISPEEVAAALVATGSIESLYAPAYSSDEVEILIIDQMESMNSPEEEVINKLALTEALQGLDARLRQIVILRYFKQKTQSEIAQLMGISQVQVSRLEKKVIESLRKEIV